MDAAAKGARDRRVTGRPAVHRAAPPHLRPNLHAIGDEPTLPTLGHPTSRLALAPVLGTHSPLATLEAGGLIRVVTETVVGSPRRIRAIAVAIGAIVARVGPSERTVVWLVAVSLVAFRLRAGDVPEPRGARFASCRSGCRRRVPDGVWCSGRSWSRVVLGRVRACQPTERSTWSSRASCSWRACSQFHVHACRRATEGDAALGAILVGSGGL